MLISSDSDAAKVSALLLRETGQGFKRSAMSGRG